MIANFKLALSFVVILLCDMALRSASKTTNHIFQARTFICIGMKQPVIFYSTLFGNQEPSSSRCSSVSRLVPQDMGDFHIQRTELLVVNEQTFCGRSLKFFPP